MPQGRTPEDAWARLVCPWGEPNLCDVGEMLQRCRNPKDVGFRNYGGRGITVCDRWRDFANFLADMGERPEGMTLDRRDNDGNYEPGNCRWADTKTQANKPAPKLRMAPPGS